MSHEMIALMMFASMMLMLMTGQRVFAAIGAVASISAPAAREPTVQSKPPLIAVQSVPATSPLSRALMGLAVAVATWESRYKTRQDLKDMSSEMLYDIGLTRAEALAEAESSGCGHVTESIAVMMQ